MKKTIITVLLIIAVLVLGFLVWGFFFDQNGVLQTMVNAVVKVINDIWKTFTGGTDDILPQWGSTGDDLNSVKNGF